MSPSLEVFCSALWGTTTSFILRRVFSSFGLRGRTCGQVLKRLKIEKRKLEKKTDKNKFRWRVFRHFLKRNKNFNNISAAQSAKQQPTWNNQILGFAKNSAVSHILVYVVIQSYAWRWLDMFRLAQKIYRTNLILTHVS